MRFKLNILLFILAGISFRGLSQDPHLSQFFDANMLMNPSETGVFENDYRIHAHYRSQWSSVISNPFVTGLISYEKPYGKFGFGGLIMNSKAGMSNLNITNLTLSASYEITNDPKEEHHLIAGVQLGFIQKHITPGNLTYNNQYSGINGVTYDVSIPSYETYYSENIFLPDANFGISYSNTSENLKVKPKIGISAFHLTSPKETFLGSTNNLPIRLVSTIGGKIDLDNDNFIDANILVMKQKNVYEFNVGFLWNKFIQDANMHVFAGPYLRNKDAIILHMGANYKEYRLGLSYDINISSLSAYSNYRGGFEISFTYAPFTGKLVPSIY